MDLMKRMGYREQKRADVWLPPMRERWDMGFEKGTKKGAKSVKGPNILQEKISIS